MKLLDPFSVRGVTTRNRLFLAPVDGVFDRSFRALAIRHGVGLTCSEIIPARALLQKNAKALLWLKRAEGERPFQAQLSEHDPEVLAICAEKIAAAGLAELIDLNMGCPSRTVVNSGNGAALMRSPDLVRRIVSSVRKAVELPLSVKIRAGWDDSNRNAVEIARIAEGEGADFITVHGRTKAQGFSGKADWSVIADVVNAVKIPVIGNGDVVSSTSAQGMMAESGCAGVMIARGAFGDPWVIDRILQENDGIFPSLEELEKEILLHFSLMCEALGDDAGVKRMRSHIAWYVKGLRHVAAFRREIVRIPARPDVEARIRRYFEELRSGTFEPESSE